MKKPGSRYFASTQGEPWERIGGRAYRNYRRFLERHPADAEGARLKLKRETTRLSPFDKLTTGPQMAH